MALETSVPPDSSSIGKPKSKKKLVLGFGALGIVFGDIGTSPLYAFQSIFVGDHAIPTLDARVMGAVSLVFWTLTLVVTFKYVLIVMRADNDGEGGIMALASLAVSKTVKSKRGLAILMTLGIAGTALFYGDGMITPAISVLSAVEGLGVADPDLKGLVLPITLAVLVALFLMQRHGTAKIGKVFGPVMFVWFVTIAILGLLSVVQTPKVLYAINPIHAFDFFVGEPGLAFLALGSVVLCVTGAEALYADMGQFGRGPIRLSWFAIAVPALYLNYFGQAALILRDPAAAANPFYLLVPSELQIPMVLLATVATVIASQAVISGAFSMSGQAIRLGYLPRLTIRHTSGSQRGQIYVPAVNWALMVAVIALVLGFRSSANLSAAYGIAVTGTFAITTILITVVALKKWRISAWIVAPVSASFLIIDLAFFTANLAKFDHGGWFPLIVAAIIFSLLTTWRAGRMLMARQLAKRAPKLPEFVAELDSKELMELPGTYVYLAATVDVTPSALVQHTKLLNLFAQHTVILHLTTADQPQVADDKRIVVTELAHNVSHIVASFGFMEHVDVGCALELAAARGVDVDPQRCTYVLHSVSVEPSSEAPMWMPRQQLFAVMQRIAIDPMLYLHLPSDRVIDMGTIVRL